MNSGGWKTPGQQDTAETNQPQSRQWDRGSKTKYHAHNTQDKIKEEIILLRGKHRGEKNSRRIPNINNYQQN